VLVVYALIITVKLEGMPLSVISHNFMDSHLNQLRYTKIRGRVEMEYYKVVRLLDDSKMKSTGAATLPFEYQVNYEIGKESTAYGKSYLFCFEKITQAVSYCSNVAQSMKFFSFAVVRCESNCRPPKGIDWIKYVYSVDDIERFWKRPRAYRGHSYKCLDGTVLLKSVTVTEIVYEIRKTVTI
jgi:hypothetical protein